jgi:hypothetical protein
VNYEAFLAHKAQLEPDEGFVPLWMPDSLFGFQRTLVEWAIRRGRSALIEDCGLGKSPQELVWAQNVVQKTNGAVLLLTPLAVTSQMLREAEKFGIEAKRAEPGAIGPGIHVTNYERLHHFDPGDFVGVVGDEAGILKNFEGATRAAVTCFMRKMRYRLLATATAAPNDYYELGNLSEALGYLGFIDMLSRFFKNNRNNTAMNTMGHLDRAPVWRFRGHAERPFWRWVCSWARTVRKPSDLGFEDGPFKLPALVKREHIVKARKPREGMLFSVAAFGLAEEREERRRTLNERCEMAAELVAHTGQPAVLWAELNDEGDLLERLIPGAIQIAGKDSDEAKEEKFEAFGSGQARTLVIKRKIGAWGLNWQHCAHSVGFATHSFEADYQATRRFWRFGQKRDVVVEYVLSDGEHRILANLQRKAERADKLFAEITRHVVAELDITRSQHVFDKTEEIPQWLWPISA